jgi:hypothetical protein
VTSPFYGNSKLSLKFGTGSGNPAGKNFTLIVDKTLQRIYIFVIDVNHTGLGEFALFLFEIAFFWDVLDS